MTESNALSVVEGQPRPPKAALMAGATPRAIVPVDFDGAYRIANVVVQAGMAPKTLGSVEKAMVAILHGLEVGLTPMNALQSIAVINGRPTIWGDGAIGLIRASGLLEYMQERFEGEGDKITAVCIVKRKGEPKEVRGEFSWSDVLRAGLNKKEGPWQTYPRRMMQMRARWPLRDVFADVLKGLALKEEVEDMEREDVVHHEPEPPVVRRVPSPPPIDKPAEPKATESPSDGFPSDKPAPAKKQDPISSGVDFPGDKPMPRRDDSIPPALDRKLTPSETKWLAELDKEYGECSTSEELISVQESSMLPSKASASAYAYARAVAITKQHVERVQNG